MAEVVGVLNQSTNMDYRSKLGYSKVSPFNKERANMINADGIDMRNTSKPLLALNRKGATMLNPGGYYPGVQGQTTEMPVETLLELEPVLLELHLSTLKGDQKEEFMDKYGVLGTNMRIAALSQILAKHPEVGQQVAQMQMQDGGSAQPQFLGDLPSYAPESRSTLETRPQPVQGINYNTMFLDFALPLTNEAQRLDRQGKYGEASALRSDVMSANQFRQDMESGAKMKKGGKAHALTPEKAKEILHDGTVHGKPITDKQRRFFGAVASGKAKMQSGGKIDAESVKGMDAAKLKAVQTDLKARGLYTGKIDGIYGKLTDRAIKLYNGEDVPAAQKINARLASKSTYQPVVSESNKGNSVATRRPTEAEVQAQMDASGVPADRSRSQLLPDFMNRRLYDNFLPAFYESATYSSPVTRFLDATVMGNPDPSIANTRDDKGVFKDWKARYDAWAMYLGQPQKDKTFKVSDYKPTDNPGDGYYYDFASLSDSQKRTLLQKYLSNPKSSTDKPVLAVDSTDEGLMGAMGTFKLSKGRDKNGHYVSYYDKWDLAGSHGVGKPFDIYGRIYYDPKTGKPVRMENGGGIDIKESHKGRFTETAKRHGMGVQEFADMVLAHKENYSKSLVKQANFARNAASWNQNGGKSWTYQAPPMEGMVLTGIESNRPVKEKLPTQGTGSSNKARTSAPVASTPEEEAFWAKLRDVNNARTAPVQAKSVIDSLSHPKWLEDSRPAYSPQVSATSASIAQMVGQEAAAVIAPYRRTWSATDLQRSNIVYDSPYSALLTEEALRNRYRPVQEFIPLLTEEALLQKRFGRTKQAPVK